VDDKNFIINLESHQTRDTNDSHVNGELTVVWRDWDRIIKNPQMIYLNSVNPREIKGPHIHKNRTSYFLCIEGKMIIIVKDNNGKYHEIKTNSKECKLISVSKGIAAAIVNPSENISKILVLADVAWKPNDNEMTNVTFDDYNWNKWINN
jgi:dTDP-4-dehydrorhamnose 3,5-epimerase